MAHSEWAIKWAIIVWHSFLFHQNHVFVPAIRPLGTFFSNTTMFILTFSNIFGKNCGFLYWVFKCINFSLKKWLWRLKYLNSTCCIQVWVYICHEYLSTALQCSLVKFYLKFCHKHFITCDHTHFNFGFCWVISSWAGDTVQSVPKDSRDNEFEPRLIWSDPQ